MTRVPLRARKLMALLACACVIAALLLGPWLAAAHEHHHCTGEHCAVCAMVRAAEGLTKRLSAAGSAAPGMLLLLFLAALALLRCVTADLPAATPVARNVRLNH